MPRIEEKTPKEEKLPKEEPKEEKVQIEVLCKKKTSGI